MEKIGIDRIKELQLKMLEWLNMICNENSIHCCLSGGTLLGAVRHEGFIPWDDDIDVMIPRNEYNRLIRILKNNHYRRYSLITTGTESAYPFAKLVDNYTRTETFYTHMKNDNRIWIDVFPVDGLPENPFLCRLKYKKTKFLQYGLAFSCANLHYGKNQLRRLLKIILSVPSKLLKTTTWGKLIDIESRKIPFENSKYVGVQCWGYGYKERMPGDEWRNYQKKTFEGKEYYVPGCWDYYLKSLYGDYMKLPPVDKRKTHRITAYLLNEEEIKGEKK